MQVQQDIENLLDMCFGDKEFITLKDLQTITEEKSSDMLLSILNLLKERLPCTKNFKIFQENYNS